MTPDRIKAVQRLEMAVLETIKETEPRGATAGVTYPALMAQGVTQLQFDSLMNTLIMIGKASIDESFCYHITAAGEQLLEVLKEKFPTAP